MSTFYSRLMLAALVVPWSLAHASRPIEESRPANPNGMVEVVDVAGSVEFKVWDRSEVAVSGTVDDGVEGVDVSAAGNRTSISVILRSGVSRGGGEARLLIHVPATSSLSVTVVSAELKLSGIRGDVKLQTVSGDVSGDIGGDLRASTVNGSVRLTARNAKNIEIRTISGDVHLAGGGGEVAVTTVSGTAQLELGMVTRGRLRSVSGKMTAALTLAPDAQFEGESVSGSILLDFSAVPDADFDIQTFSGDIHNCFGPAAAKPRYGPGSRLVFKNGTGLGRIRLDTKSGDIRLCTKNAQDKVAAIAPAAHAAANVFYVL
jgi:hypothetical protein